MVAFCVSKTVQKLKGTSIVFLILHSSFIIHPYALSPLQIVGHERHRFAIGGGRPRDPAAARVPEVRAPIHHVRAAGDDDAHRREA